jgi:hypothetical protein
MRTTFKIIFLALFLSVAGFVVLNFFVPTISHAQVQISASIPGKYDLTSSGTVPGQFVYDFYQYALAIGGILAFGIVVYGGVRYMISAGNPSGQSDAKEWIQAALMGILLLAGAYFILNVINPNLVNLTLPTLQTVQIATNTGGSAGGGTGSSGGGSSPTNSQAAKNLTSAGIGVKAGAIVAGLRNSIVNSLVSLASKCGCSITVTAGTDGTHRPGEYSHSQGYKADLHLDAGLNNYITNTNNFTSMGPRSDGAAMYKDKSTGAIYARESNHWDVVSKG